MSNENQLAKIIDLLEAIAAMAEHLGMESRPGLKEIHLKHHLKECAICNLALSHPKGADTGREVCAICNRSAL